MRTADGLKLLGRQSCANTAVTEHGVMNVAKHGSQRKKKQTWLKLSVARIANGMMNKFPCAKIVGCHGNAHFSALTGKGGEVE